jgi:hypothetical protein
MMKLGAALALVALCGWLAWRTPERSSADAPSEALRVDTAPPAAADLAASRRTSS